MPQYGKMNNEGGSFLYRSAAFFNTRGSGKFSLPAAGSKGAMRFEKHEVRITDHGYDQYCSRVEPINRKILTETCQQQLIVKDYTRRKGNYLHLGGVWWVYVIENDSALCFITCYGRTEIDLPRALSWAALHDDRIVLSKATGVTL